MSAHGYQSTVNEITPENHAFDPTSKAAAQLLINGFRGLQTSIGIDTSEFSFYLNTAFLNRLLTESRNGYKEGQGKNPDLFDGLKVYFGLTADNQIMLLMERAIFDPESTTEFRLEYKKVAQMISTYRPDTDEYKLIDYAVVPVNEDGISQYGLMDTHNKQYKKLRADFKERFQNDLSEISVIVPSIAGSTVGKSVKFATLRVGYFLGKTTLRRELWANQGCGVGIKLFLGYGPNDVDGTQFQNMHLIAIGATHKDATIADYPYTTVWSTQTGSVQAEMAVARMIDLSGQLGDPALEVREGGPSGSLTSSCVGGLY